MGIFQSRPKAHHDKPAAAAGSWWARQKNKRGRSSLGPEPKCSYQLRVTTDERIAFLAISLGRALDGIKGSEIYIAEPLLKGARLDSTGLPVATYLTVPPKLSSCVHRRPATRLQLQFIGTETDWYDDGAKGDAPRQLRGPRFGLGTNFTSMASALRNVVSFLKREPKIKRPIELVINRKKHLWYKFEHGHPASASAVARLWTLSPALQRVAAGMEQTYFRCGGSANATVDVAATARIAYVTHKSNRGTPEEVEKAQYAACSGRLSFIVAASKAAQPQQRCPHFLATDWFVNADPLSHTGEKATRRCWETIMSNATSPLWWWLDEKAIGRIVADEPSLKVALKEDPATLRLFLEIAMLVRAKTCIAKSHIGDKIVNPLRAKTGKTECVMH